MSTASLGAYQREFSARAQGRWEILSGLIILLGILGIGSLAIAFSKPGQAWMGVVLIGALAGGLVWYTVGGIRKLRRCVKLHSNGILLQDGSESTVIHWEDISSLTGSLPVAMGGAPAHVGGPLEIKLRDGRQLRLSHGYEDPDVLATLVHEKVLAHLLPAAQEAYRAGKRLGMGPLQVDRTGIHLNQKTLLWTEFRSVSFTADDMQLLRTDGKPPWTSLKIAEIPNANLFVHLTRTRRQV